MGMWGMLLWVIECAECHGHSPVDLRGRWRLLQAAAGREAEAEIFLSDMGMWGMLLWVIECAECHGHGPIDLRGRWRLRDERSEPRECMFAIAGQTT